MITLQTVPVDLLLNVGTYLKDIGDAQIDNINEITLAAILKDYEMLEHYMKKCNPSDVSEKVALSGNLRVLKWVIKKGCPMDKRICEAAARIGNVDMLKWLRKRGCPWDEKTCNAAASSGNFDMLKWLHNAGCP